MEALEGRQLLSVTVTFPSNPDLTEDLDVNASNQAGTQSEVGVAVDPNDPLSIVAVANNNANLAQVAAYFSIDGGITWTANFITSADDGQGAGDSRFDPNVAFDHDGNAHVIYSLNTGAASRLMLVSSNDGGANWTQSATVTTDAGNSNIHTAMVTTRNDPGGPDDVLVTYARVVGNEEIEAALSLDAGATFTVTNGVLNDNAPERTFLPWAEVDNNGNFHITWEVNLAGDNPEGRLFHDVLNGNTLADGGDVTVSDLMITDFDDANSKIPAQPNRGLFSVSSIDIDRSGGPFNGRVYVVYSDRPNVASADLDIFLRFSTNNGANWSAPIQINDDVTTTSQFMPRMDVDQTSGAIFVGWYDARDDVANNRAVNVYAAVSADGGQTWSPNVRVSAQSSDVAIAGNNGNDYTEYMGLSAVHHRAYVVWTDKRASNFTANREDVFVGLVSIDDQSITVTGDMPVVNQDDQILVTLDASGTFLQITVNGVLVKTVAASAVQNLTVLGLGGADSVTVDFVNGNPIPPGGMTVAGGTGIDTLNVENAPPISYTPDPGDGPADGVLTMGGSSISFTGFEFVRPVDPVLGGIALSTLVIDEGDGIMVSGSFIDPGSLSSHTLEVNWGDGSANTVVNLPVGNRAFQANHAYLDDNPTGTPFDINAVTVIITDNDNLSDADNSGMITVNNLDPVIVDFASDATFADKTLPGDPVNILAHFTDVGVQDTHAAEVDWGDGTVEMVTVIQGAGFGTVTGSHAYATGGIFNVTLALSDDDTGTDGAATTAVISGVGLTPAGILQIVGSNDDDRVTIAKIGGLTRVYADFLLGVNFETFDTSDIVKVIAYLCDGDDYFVINSNVVIPAIVHGGEGADLLKAGGGPSVLEGDEGDDRLIGGNDRDIIIGGIGADLLMGGLGEDLLIGGTTTHDHDDMALMDLLTEWNQPDAFSVRTDRLRNGTGVTGIQLAKGLTVFDDPESDLLVGAFGTDWFFFDPLKDTTPDRKNNEAAN